MMSSDLARAISVRRQRMDRRSKKKATQTKKRDLNHLLDRWPRLIDIPSSPSQSQGHTRRYFSCYTQTHDSHTLTPPPPFPPHALHTLLCGSLFGSLTNGLDESGEDSSTRASYCKRTKPTASSSSTKDLENLNPQLAAKPATVSKSVGYAAWGETRHMFAAEPPQQLPQHAAQPRARAGSSNAECDHNAAPQHLSPSRSPVHATSIKNLLLRIMRPA